ncbi:MAG: 50S ribosomal protein L35 [Candidatus Cloacimonadota bacterium]|nr:MAG: 50S ribosomal protein L35 [Candidatus Cloacimonadota bacterium]
MPKIKTRKSAFKRFKPTGNGKIKRSKAFHDHLATHKTRKTKRNLRKSTYIADADTKRVKKMLNI